jgi:hypothetical protein
MASYEVFQFLQDLGRGVHHRRRSERLGSLKQLRGGADRGISLGRGVPAGLRYLRDGLGNPIEAAHTDLPLGGKPAVRRLIVGRS